MLVTAKRGKSSARFLEASLGKFDGLYFRQGIDVFLSRLSMNLALMVSFLNPLRLMRVPFD